MTVLAKIEILIDGIWTRVELNELKNYNFDCCRITEQMTKKQFEEKFYATKTPQTATRQ